jgi:hypothetical protein
MEWEVRAKFKAKTGSGLGGIGLADERLKQTL